MPDIFFLLGVGGMGMSAIANYLLDQGHIVGGTDREPHRGKCLLLSSRGAHIHLQGGGGLREFALQHRDRTIRVIRSAAVEADVPEMLEAAELGLVVEERVPFLTGMFNRARLRVAVVGSAGKTTTAALLAHILVKVNLDPSYVIGGLIGGAPNGRFGRTGLFLVEADESDGSVVEYRPDLLLFTNLFAEHKSLDELRNIFLRLFDTLPEGAVVLWGRRDSLLEMACPRATRFADLPVPVVVVDEQIHVQSAERLFRIPLAGAHNIPNIKLAVTGAVNLGIELRSALEALESFPGVENRMAKIGQAGGVTVYNDFAHSPVEIEASYASAIGLSRRVIYVYQPHGYRPTHVQKDALVETFGAMRADDLVVLTDVYYGGGTVHIETTGRDLYEGVLRVHANSGFVPRVDDLPAHIAEIARFGDVVILAGVRTILDCGHQVLRQLGR